MLMEGNRSLMVLVVKNSPANAGDTSSTLISGRSPRVGNGHPLQYNCLEKLHGQRNLVGYCPCFKELNMTEHTHIETIDKVMI